jgi:hypothetical protein
MDIRERLIIITVENMDTKEMQASDTTSTLTHSVSHRRPLSIHAQC